MSYLITFYKKCRFLVFLNINLVNGIITAMFEMPGERRYYCFSPWIVGARIGLHQMISLKKINGLLGIFKYIR